jgi:hypothetical protein
MRSSQVARRTSVAGRSRPEGMCSSTETKRDALSSVAGQSRIEQLTRYQECGVEGDRVSSVCETGKGGVGMTDCSAETSAGWQKVFALPSRPDSGTDSRVAKQMLGGKTKTTAPRIPMWSPTMVLTERYPT